MNTTYVSPRERKLLNDFRYIDDVEGVIVCEAGLIIDGASFGRLLSPIFGEQHDYAIPAAPHDRLYLNNNINGRYLTRKQCDEVLYRAMKCAGFQEHKAKLFYHGVRFFFFFLVGGLGLSIGIQRLDNALKEREYDA